MASLDRSAAALRADWQATGAADRAPRLATFGGGRTPYLLPDVYVFEALVSYRSQCSFMPHHGLWADYVHLLVLADAPPLHGLPQPWPGRYWRVAVERFAFNGVPQEVRLFRNLAPLAGRPLPARVHGPCPPVRLPA